MLMKDKVDLLVFIDTWSLQRTFIEKELVIFASQFNITVVCNDDVDIESIDERLNNVKFIKFDYRSNPLLTWYIRFIGLFDRDFRFEIKEIFKSRHYIKERLKESDNFYLCAQLFYRFLRKRRLIYDSHNLLIYSYWYYWKCLAVTNHRNKYPHIKVITKTHGYDLFDERIESLRQPYKKQMDANLDKVIFVSDYAREYYLERYNKKISDKYMLSYLGTSNEYGVYSNYKKQDKIVLVSCSNLVPLKRVNLIIEALSVSTLNIQWIHFGSGPLMEELRTYSEKKLNNRSNIAWEFRGYTANSEILKFYHANQVDLLITTTKTEGGNPVSVQEAMSFGIPIIATNVCNNSHMIQENGYLLSEDPDAKEIADCFNDFMNKDKEEVWKMRKNSRVLWEDKFTAEKNYKVLLDKITKMIENNNR